MFLPAEIPLWRVRLHTISCINEDALKWMLLVKIVRMNWPEPCAAQTPDQPRASCRRHAQWHISPKTPPSTAVRAPRWEQKARTGLGLRAAAWGGSLGRFLLPDLQPGPTTEQRQTPSRACVWRGARMTFASRKEEPRPQGNKTLWAGKRQESRCVKGVFPN